MTSIDTGRKPAWEPPRLIELNLLTDTGLGFSEPPPPSEGDGPGEGGGEPSRDDASERERFDWL